MARNVSAQCSPGADTAALDRIFISYLASFTAGESNAIAVLPFLDLHGYQAEPLLPNGMPALIYDMYSDANPIVHPYVSATVAASLGIFGDTLDDAASAKALAEKLGVRFVVFGDVQRTSETGVRVIVDVYDAKTQTSVSPATEFNAELNDAFFGLVRSRLTDAFKKTHLSLRSVPYKDPALNSFRYYVRGLQLASRHDKMSLDLAGPWLEKALKDNYEKYDDAALVLARSYFMAALIQRMNKTDFTQNMLKGKSALKFVTGTRRTTKFALTYRYLDDLSHFLTALTALNARNASMAAHEALAAVGAVPEDGLAEEIYWRAIDGTKTKPAIARNAPVCL